MSNNDKRISDEEERAIKENLQNDIDEFLSRGGEVEEVGYGETKYGDRPLPFRYDDADL